MLRREMGVVLGARLTWLQAALAALLVGHGFVLAMDIFSSGSRSVGANVLIASEFDPLAGIVRPTLGGLYLAVSLLGPLVAARSLSVEKERNTFAALILETGRPAALLGAKLLSAVVGLALPLGATLVVLVLWRALGGHLAFGETAVAFGGHLLYLLFVASLGLLAAALTRTLAQATALALLVIAASWAIDASEGFSALAWLGGATTWSATTHLAPFEHGTLDGGAVLWFLAVSATAFGLAAIAVRFDVRRRVRVSMGLALAAIGALVAAAIVHAPVAIDATEMHRASLPPAAVAALRALPGDIVIEPRLDREDSRRRQLESDPLAKLRLARPDMTVRWLLDARGGPSVLDDAADPAYGKITIRVGDRVGETTSTSPNEIVTRILALAGRAPPPWDEPPYPGYPIVVDGARRDTALVIAYVALPLTLAGLGFGITRTRRRRS